MGLFESHPRLDLLVTSVGSGIGYLIGELGQVVPPGRSTGRVDGESNPDEVDGVPIGAIGRIVFSSERSISG